MMPEAEKSDRALVKVSMLVWNTFLNDARVLNEAKTLVAAGYSVKVHALHATGITQKCQILDSGVEVSRYGQLEGRRQLSASSRQASNNLYKWLATFVLRSVTMLQMIFGVWRSKPDIIHAHDVNMLPAAWLVAGFLRIPLIYDAHEISTDREGYKTFRNLVAWIEKKLMPTAAATITTTDLRAKFFARAYNIPRPLVLQNRPRVQTIGRTQRIRDELGLPRPWPIVLYQGGLQQGRGLLNLVEAAKSVPEAYFVFIGGGRQAEELHVFAASMALIDRVYFIPTVALSELPIYTASADIGLQPIENTCLNHFTTDSNKLFEYVIAGLPVIASRMPEIRKVVESYDLGLLVKPGSIDGLIDALNTLVSQPSLRLYYADQACAASVSLSWEAQEQKLIDLYHDTLDKKRGWCD